MKMLKGACSGDDDSIGEGMVWMMGDVRGLTATLDPISGNGSALTLRD